MKKLIKIPEYDKICIDVGVEDDFNKVNSDGSYQKKTYYYIPKGLIATINDIIDNLNEITESKLGRSIMNLEKGADD